MAMPIHAAIPPFYALADRLPHIINISLHADYSLTEVRNAAAEAKPLDEEGLFTHMLATSLLRLSV